MNEYIEVNQRHWDEVVPIHVASELYDVASFKAGLSSLMPIELNEVGHVRGKALLPLQCHFGLDTLSWARAGASVTGIDFSRQAVEAARELATELNIEASFVESNIYDLPQVLQDQFDVVFTSYGALLWLPDIVRWARVAASYVKPGGFLYVVEGHPMVNTISSSPSAAGL